MSDEVPRPRITFALSDGGQFLEIYLNEEGRRLLVDRLLSMDLENEHLHLSPDEFGDIATSTVAYRTNETVVPYGKIYLRSDDWDREYFPHVMVKVGET